MKKEDSAKDNKFGFASFMLGLFSVMFFFLVIPSLIMGIVGIIFAIIQLRKGKSKWAIAGLVLSIIGLAGAIYILIKLVSVLIGVYACQADIASENCIKFIATMGIDTGTMTCLLTPSASGCEELMAAKANPT